MDLSVLSLLARLGQDPWAETTRLACLPTVTAAEALARAIASLPEDCHSAAQARTTAFGLVRLLPSAVGSSQGVMPPDVPARTRIPAILAYGCTLGAALMFGVLLAATLQGPSRTEAPLGDAAASTLHQPKQGQ